MSGRVPLPLLAIYEHAVIGMRAVYLLFTFFLSHNRGGSASSAALLTAALLTAALTEIYFGFIQIQRPHLPHGHALRHGALGEALPRPLLAHLVAPPALFSQHVWHMDWFMRYALTREYFFEENSKETTTNEPTK